MIPRDDTIARTGRLGFAIALLAFAAANLVVGDLVAGRAPAWPDGVPGRLVWSTLTAALFAAAGVMLLRTVHAPVARHPAGPRWAERALYGVTAAIVLGALLRYLPLIAADRQLGGAWTSFGKSLALAGGALGVASTIGAPRALHAVGRVSLGAFLVLGGIQHFLFAPFVATLVPAWIPGSLAWTYVAGVGLLAGGVGLMIPRTARLAAMLVGAMIFTWVIVLHIPRAVTMNDRNEWTALIEAISMSAMAWALVKRGEG
jgi:uncharacterized membrane protein